MTTTSKNVNGQLRYCKTKSKTLVKQIRWGRKFKNPSFCSLFFRASFFSWSREALRHLITFSWLLITWSLVFISSFNEIISLSLDPDNESSDLFFLKFIIAGSTVFLELVSKELNHFGVIACLFRQICAILLFLKTFHYKND